MVPNLVILCCCNQTLTQNGKIDDGRQVTCSMFVLMVCLTESLAFCSMPHFSSSPIDQELQATRIAAKMKLNEIVTPAVVLALALPVLGQDQVVKTNEVIAATDAHQQMLRGSGERELKTTKKAPAKKKTTTKKAKEVKKKAPTKKATKKIKKSTSGSGRSLLESFLSYFGGI